LDTKKKKIWYRQYWKTLGSIKR